MNRFLVILLALSLCRAAFALETDQYTVPPKPLDDIGAVWQKHLDENLRQILDGLNQDFDKAIEAAADTSSQSRRARKISEAASCLRERTLADRFYDRFGPGLPECTDEHWVHELHKDFSVSPNDSVYGIFVIQRPITIIMMSPTVNAWGVYFGTDKVGHLFQQGHEYYSTYMDHIGEGDAKAKAAAVEHGAFQENTFYGYALDGVYSHGDLAADYAGFKFYLNLTHPIVVNGVTRPPIVILRNSHWQRNPAVTDEYLRPFISNHLNESLNPCRYNPQLRGTVQRHLKDLAPAWLAFYHITPAQAARQAKDLSTWYGEDYGHSGMDKVLLIPIDEKPAFASAP
jgi:hypothetical protein